MTTIDLEPHEQFRIKTRRGERIVTQVRFMNGITVTGHLMKKDGTPAKLSAEIMLFGADQDALPKWLQHLHLAHRTTVQGYTAEVASWDADATVGP